MNTQVYYSETGIHILAQTWYKHYKVDKVSQLN